MLKTTKAAGFREYALTLGNTTITLYDANLGMTPAYWVAYDNQGNEVASMPTKRDLLEVLEHSKYNR